LQERSATHVTELRRGQHDAFPSLLSSPQSDNHDQQWLAFRLVEHRQLRRIVIDRLLEFAVEQTVAQQLDLFFQVDDVHRIDASWWAGFRKKSGAQHRGLAERFKCVVHGPLT